jgi:hypothetical protein
VSEALNENGLRPYREAIRQRVCVVCLDGTDDGRCGLEGSLTCAIDEHLPGLVAAVLDVGEHHDGAYAAAVEARVCSRCSHRDALGLCHLRRDGRCALAVFLPLIVEAVLEVAARRNGRRA